MKIEVTSEELQLVLDCLEYRGISYAYSGAEVLPQLNALNDLYNRLSEIDQFERDATVDQERRGDLERSKQELQSDRDRSPEVDTVDEHERSRFEAFAKGLAQEALHRAAIGADQRDAVEHQKRRELVEKISISERCVENEMQLER